MWQPRQCSHKTATQVSCCKEWQSLSLIRGDSNDNSYMLHDQTDKVLSSLVMELQEEVERLRSIREAKEETRLVEPSSALSQKQEYPPEKKNPQRSRAPCNRPLPGWRQQLKGEQWMDWVHTWGSRKTPSLPTLPSQVPLYKRSAQDVEGQSMDNVDDSKSTQDMSPRSERLFPVSQPTPQRKKCYRWGQQKVQYVRQTLLGKLSVILGQGHH